MANRISTSRTRISVSLFLFAALFTPPFFEISASADDGQLPIAKGEKLFALQVKPMFAEKCLACHGNDPDDLKGGLDMNSREAILRGGDSYGDQVLLPGNGIDSFLFIAATRAEEGFEMPPKVADRLRDEQTRWIRDWIDAGAPWPSEERIAMIQEQYAAGLQVETSGGLGDAWTNRRYESSQLWAYRPLKVVSVPEVTHAVDWFVDQRLDSLGLKAAPTADPLELVRRLSFGLTGLPPNPQDATQFVDAFASDADSAVREYSTRLMQSPQYGEHFGRQWLDVARYADSAGFANDYARPNAWRYRDYVVRSFNNDKRYDEFVREQLAGDELDDKNPENIVATGFLRMGPWEQTGMSVFRVTRQQWLDDVIDSVGQTFLGHALQCAKCHDHKFDPVPTRDYYRMMAIFSTTQFSEREAPFLDVENRGRFEAANQWTTAKIAAYEKQRNELNQRVKQNRTKEGGHAKVGDNGLAPGDEASLARMGKNIQRHRWELDKTRPIALGVHTGKTLRRGSVNNRILLPATPWEKGLLEQDTILTGGDPFARGELVTPGPLSAAVKLGAMSTPDFPMGRGKRRLALANWIVDAQNPLAARVIVNRVWRWHFGKGIASNPNNLGATGGNPTHPALLDHLADWFMANDWSIKKLNLLILTSSAYRRSSRHPNLASVDEADPKREFYSTFLSRRLTAEELRDAMLFVSGELNRQVGGIPCRPDINLEVAMQPRQIMGGTASVYEPDSLPAARNRRSLYAEKIRGLRDPFLETFNQPGPDKSCEARETSTIAPQALTLMNSSEVHDRALAFAARLMKIDASDEVRLKQAFELAFGRAPSTEEATACMLHWDSAAREEEGKQYQPREFASQTVRTVMAEKTGEPYDFVERMPAYDGYVPDLQPSQTDARTRGLAHLCLVIFNLNEFAYLD